MRASGFGRLSVSLTSQFISTGRMPERRLTFNPGFKPGTKLVRMPDSSLKLVHMPEGGLTLDPGLALWIKAQKLILL